MSKIYIVFGTAGEYSDRYEWPIIAYRERKDAEKHVINATERARELYAMYRDDYYSIPQGANQFDPDMSVSYAGTGYYFSEVDLKE